ncbi:MAG: outer membrane beta-barrel protein [Usitatibacter sp.]
MTPRIGFAALAFALLPAVASAEDYLGGIKLPRPAETAGGTFSIASEPVATFASSTARASDAGLRLKLGYKYSRYFSVESEFVDFGRAPADIFASPGNLASAFRSTGFGVDTVAMLPVWRSFSFYGRFGAYRGETRNVFATYSTSLLGENAARGTRWRYGLGMRYDFTPRLGIHAELERYSPLGSPLAGEPDSELVSVGVNWRF